MNNQLNGEVVRLLGESEAVDSAAKSLRKIVLGGEFSGYDIDRYVAVLPVVANGMEHEFDFKIYAAGRQVLAHYERFSIKRGSVVASRGRFKFFLKEEDPTSKCSYVEEPIFTFNFDRVGDYKIDDDALNCFPNEQYFARDRNRILVHVVAALHRMIFEIGGDE